MKINNIDQISITVFISTLSAVSLDASNYPLATLPALFFIILRFLNTNINYRIRLPKNKFYSSWLIFFVFYGVLSIINILSIDIYNKSFESLLYSIIYLIYILFFSQYNFSELKEGIINGTSPMILYMILIEFPLNLINPDIIKGFREMIGLRYLKDGLTLGFFEEASHMPSLIILCITLFIFSLNKDENLHKNRLKRIYLISAILVLSLHLSLSYVLSFYMPLILFFIIKILYKMFINLRIPKLKFISIISIMSFCIVFLSNLSKINYKLNDAFNIGHSFSVRLWGLISSFYDITINPLLGAGAGMYRVTRFEAINGFKNFFESNDNIFDFLTQSAYATYYDSITFTQRGYVPVYSMTGYLISETGIFCLLFFIPLIFLIIKSLKFAWKNYNGLNIDSLVNILLGLLPINYLIYISIGYPRMLPYFIISMILIERYLNAEKV